MTRARERLYLTHARRRMSYGNLRANPPSRFLGDLPDKDVQTPVGANRAAPRTGGLRAAAATARQEHVDATSPSFAPGDRVHHATFGNGVVIACVLVPGDQQVTVAFEGQGVKKLMLSFAPLRAIGSEA
jgi:DNA helicase-2/ATP-dependent DNA helicase PcrA